jgi:hypothetical protein
MDRSFSIENKEHDLKNDKSYYLEEPHQMNFGD